MLNYLLVQTTDCFSYSFTEQKANPYKVYAIDPGLYNAVSFKFSENIGRIFERQERSSHPQRTVEDERNIIFGRTFWARGYCVSTVGLDERQIRQYIKEQEELQKKQLEFDFN